MLSPRLMRQIRRIEFKSRRLVNNAFAGAYQSVYKGRGLSFAAVRPYQPGDDVRSIDWKVTARTGEPFIKQHIEERELTLMIVIDGSESVIFGTQDRQKREFAAELGAVLAYAANQNNDKAGLMIFSDHIEHYIPPKKGRNHLLHMIRDLLTLETSGQGTDLALALRTANNVLPAGAIIFLLSDFLLPADQYRREMLLVGQRHELINVVLSDPLEDHLPDVGIMGMRDSESGTVEWVDTSSKKWQKQFRDKRDTFLDNRQQVFNQSGAAMIDMPADGDYVRSLSRFFQQQARMRSR